MRHVTFDPATLTGEARQKWDDWEQKAQAARAVCLGDIQNRRKHEFKHAVWSELKQLLFAYAFNGKCGYCESSTDVTAYGDADHYRPKGRITVLKEGKRVVLRDQDDQPHPGYYWLAYDWRNIVPACQRCNSEGKADQFPVAGNHVFPPPAGDAPDWDALDADEQPLLLHPYRDDPNMHLRFGSKGTVAPRDESPMGAESIRVYKLGREPLKRERQSEQEDAWNNLRLAMLSESPAEALRPWQCADRAYSSAVLQFVRRKWRRLREELAALD